MWLVIGYIAVLAFVTIFQREFLYHTESGSVLRTPGTLAIAGSQRVSIPTPDGENIAAWYRPPADPGAVVFLFFHGKGGGLERKRWRWKRIIDRGAGILAISYRGFPGSSGFASEQGLHLDARSAFNWLNEKRRIPNNRIVLHGLSLGTGVAAKLATEVDAAALVLEAPYTAIVDVAAERFPFWPVSLLLRDQFRTRDVIGGVRMPVMIAHGTGDTVIPFAHARRLYSLAPSPKKFIIMRGSDHSTLVRDGLYQHIWRFLAQNRA